MHYKSLAYFLSLSVHAVHIVHVNLCWCTSRRSGRGGLHRGAEGFSWWVSHTSDHWAGQWPVRSASRERERERERKSVHRNPGNSPELQNKLAIAFHSHSSLLWWSTLTHTMNVPSVAQSTHGFKSVKTFCCINAMFDMLKMMWKQTG